LILMIWVSTHFTVHTLDFDVLSIYTFDGCLNHQMCRYSKHPNQVSEP
jgi:hypothetical protein